MDYFDEGYERFEKLVEKTLMETGLKPLKDLGHGVSGVVFSVLADGKEMAAKVTNSSQDISNCSRIMKIREKLPGRYAKNIVKIYDIRQLPDDCQDNLKEAASEAFMGGDGPFHVVLSEVLAKAPKSLLKAWAAPEIGESAQEVQERNEDRKWNAGDMAKNLLLFPGKLKELLLASFLDEKKDLNAIGLNRHQIEWLAGFMSTAPQTELLIESFLQQVEFEHANRKNPHPWFDLKIDRIFLRSLVKEAESKIAGGNPEFFQVVSGIAGDSFKFIFGKVLAGGWFPESRMECKRDREKMSLLARSTDPRIESLMDTLNFLADHEGMEWINVDSNNVMVRPSTGDLVVFDFGEFTSRIAEACSVFLAMVKS